MAEQSFKFPGFVGREIELIQDRSLPTGRPIISIGAAERGPAFVPISVASQASFAEVFGDPDASKPAGFSALFWLQNQNAATFVRTLGGGANDTLEDIATTKSLGSVKNAGFRVIEDDSEFDNRGSLVYVLSADHDVQAADASASGSYTRNPSITSQTVDLVRGVIFTASGFTMHIADPATFTPTSTTSLNREQTSLALSGEDSFLIVFRTLPEIAPKFGKAVTVGGTPLRQLVIEASLDPKSANYIGTVLNRSTTAFAEKGHVLYGEFPVESGLASVDTYSGSVRLSAFVNTAMGSLNSDSLAPADSARTTYGRYDTRYTTPSTPWLISQPFGSTEYDLFRVETLSDGEWGNTKVKISISNLKASVDPNNSYGTFDLLVRRFDDTDDSPEVLERWTNCNLNPESERYVARLVGDARLVYNWDADDATDRRLTWTGKWELNSQWIRVVAHPDVENGNVPSDALPFGFRGLPAPKFMDSIEAGDEYATSRLVNGAKPVVPPLPFRFKSTLGSIAGSAGEFSGQHGTLEGADPRLFWGVQFQNISDVLRPNSSQELNRLVNAYTRFFGLPKLDVQYSDSEADTFGANKFSLARVALPPDSAGALTRTPKEIMVDAAYLRDASPDASNFYRVQDADALGNTITRKTFATLAAFDKINFNRLNDYAKFTVPMFGGFDGLNILDPDNANMSDRSCSTEEGGSAAEGAVDAGFNTDVTGEGLENNCVRAFRTAVGIISDVLVASYTIITVPGIRDPFITDYVLELTQQIGRGLYVMDIPSYDYQGNRLFKVTKTDKPDPQATADALNARAIDNQFGAVYWPDCIVTNPGNDSGVRVPASVVAASAYGFSDKVGHPWYAPAGYNRGLLGSVRSIEVQMFLADRSVLAAARINPILYVTGDAAGSRTQRVPVLFSQYTLKSATATGAGGGSAFTRVNVVRLFNEMGYYLFVAGLKNILFEPIDEAARSAFVESFLPQLLFMQQQNGFSEINVVCDTTNNTPIDEEERRVNCRIEVRPNRSTEFIAADFVVSRSGVSLLS